MYAAKNLYELSCSPLHIQEEDTGQPPPYPEAVIVMDIVGNIETFSQESNGVIGVIGVTVINEK